MPSRARTGVYLEISQPCCRPHFPASDPGLFTHRGLVWELQQKLLLKAAQSLQPGQTLVLIIDGADTLVDHNGQLISDWIPKSLPRVSEGEARLRQEEGWREGCGG